MLDEKAEASSKFDQRLNGSNDLYALYLPEPIMIME
jgi:hypothetical protein